MAYLHARGYVRLMRPVSWCALAISVAASLPAGAQCPDGTPRPCDTRPAVRLVPSVPPAGERARRFVILPFRNVTRQADQDWLVEGSTTMLTESLGRWEGIRVVRDERLYPTLKQLNVTPGSVIGPAQMRRIAEETGGWTAVTGEILTTGGKVRVTSRALDVVTNRELVRATSEVAVGGDIRVAFDSVSLRLLRSVGIDSLAADLGTATTHNLDAYRSYLSALAHERRSEVKPAIADMQQAVKLDSSFALAWARLASLSIAEDPTSILNPGSKAAQYSARAVTLSAKLPARQRQLVLGSDATFRAQFSEARKAFEGLVATDSTDIEALSALLGLESFDPVLVSVPGGQRPRQSPNRAARIAKRITQLDPQRSSMYGFLAQLYGQAGVPGVTPTLGVDKETSSFPELLQLVRQPEHRRLYYPVVRDSFELVPAESLSFIPKDSVKASRKRARETALAWADRWIQNAPDVAAARQLAAELHAYDDNYPAALAALAKAESLGIATPNWVPAARRLYYYGKAGDFTAATRLADSLTTAGMFANPNAQLINGESMSWAFALHLFNGRAANAATLLDQATQGRRAMTPPGGPPPEQISVMALMGNGDPDDEPRIPRSMRIAQFDTIIAHLRDFTAPERLGLWLPQIVGMLGEASDPKKPRFDGLLPAADALAATGARGAKIAFEIVSNAVSSDSTLEPSAARYGWYRSGAEAFNAAKRAAANRIHPGTATIAADRAVFEWRIDDTTAFRRNRPESPVGRGEYRWEITLEGADRYHRFNVSVPAKPAGAPEVTGTLSEILTANPGRGMVTGRMSPAGVQLDTTAVQSVAVQVETPPGLLRMIVSDKATIEAWRRTRPVAARFRFYPCVRPVGEVSASECVDQRITITYP
jgi:TolB-like protein/tetratricopeptide (TPR) repeat protein